MKKLFYVLAISVFFGFSCKKEEPNVAAMCNEALKAEVYFYDIFKQSIINTYTVQNFINSGDTTNNIFSGENCATIEVSSVNLFTWPKNYIFDYGDTNCVGIDGRYRRGKIFLQLSNSLNDSLAKASVNFDNFFINDYKLLGKLNITNIGKNTSDIMGFEVSTENTSFIGLEGMVQWNFEYQILLTDGHEVQNPNPENFSFQINRSLAQGKFGNGRPFTVEMTKALQTTNSCSWFMEGEIKITPHEMEVYTIDFGNNLCNKSATVNTGGDIQDITLP